MEASQASDVGSIPITRLNAPMNELIANLKFDTILSDPMLMVGTVLVVLGPLVFLVALWKFLTLRKTEPAEEEFFSPLPEPYTPAPPPAPPPPPPPAPEPPPVSVRSQFAAAQERTMVMPA